MIAKTVKRRMSDGITMLLVCGLSLFLVVYVGFGEAKRTYMQFQTEKVYAQGKILETAMVSYLRAGTPLRQYVGFATRAEAMLASDPSVVSVAVFDQSRRRVFSAGDESVPFLKQESHQVDDAESHRIDIRQSDDYLQVVLPLSNKFERIGDLVVTTPLAGITNMLEDKFRTVLVTAGLLSLLFAWFVSAIGPRLARHRAPWLQICYAVTFVTMSGMVVATLISLYSEGAQTKTRSLADSLGQRLRDVVDFNININELDGLDRLFEEYRRLNPEISAAALIVNDKVVIHTNEQFVGGPWETDRQSYEYVFDLTLSEPGANRVYVAVALPSEVVTNQVVRSVKNFGALFLASAFLAGLFLHLARSLQWLQFAQQPLQEGRAVSEFAEFELSLVKSVFFVAVLIEHLTYSFLPQFIAEMLSSTGMPASLVAIPFMGYYLCFALALIPAGHFAAQVGARRLIYTGLTLACFSLFALAFVQDFYTVLFARSIAGIGQGMLFIGVQCYILAKASPDKKTQGAAIIVYGFQGGMISGMAIGSLLVIYVGPQGIFTLAGAVGSAAAIYTILMLPNLSSSVNTVAGASSNLRQIMTDLSKVLRSFEFIRTIFLIGIPAKAVMTGVIIFALPLLLTVQSYAQEDIGQIIMLYALGVLIASTYVSRLVDRQGKTENFLFWGTLISGGGLLLIGASSTGLFDSLENGLLLTNLGMVLGVTSVGIAHGFINAPVLTCIADSELARKIGPNSATASYRFLERLGHVAGPIIVGQLFLFANQMADAVAWIGGAVVFLGIVFILSSNPARPDLPQQELVH
ncbi:MAG: MFS transporter [Kiloniellaceae bacterium]